MTLLDIVKIRMGILYDDALKNQEIQSMIDGALAYFKNAGWTVERDNPEALAVEAIVTYCKMANSSEAAQLRNHPVLLAFIGQGRVANAVSAEHTD